MTGSILQKASVVASLVSAVLAADVAQLEAAMRSAEQAGLESLAEYSQAKAMVRGAGQVRCCCFFWFPMPRPVLCVYY